MRLLFVFHARAQGAPKHFQGAPKSFPEPPGAPKEHLRRSKELPRATKELPRAPKNSEGAPKRPRELPRAPQELPRSSQELPRSPQESPRSTQGSPRSTWGAPVQKNCVKVGDVCYMLMHSCIFGTKQIQKRCYTHHQLINTVWGFAAGSIYCFSAVCFCCVSRCFLVYVSFCQGAF